MNLETARKAASDHALALDLLSKISDADTEKDAIEKILEMFAMLFSPRKLAYASFTGGSVRQVYSAAPPQEDESVLKKRLEHFTGRYAWTRSERGFLVSIRHKGQPLGVLEADELAFPEYREHYLNLALSIIDVCGLAIENARKYQRIKQNEALLIQEKNKLEQALSRVKQLSGLLPICSHCHKIRDDEGYWQRIDEYIQEHSEAEFSHSICRECAEMYYPNMNLYQE